MANRLAEIYRDWQIDTKVETAERMAQWLSERLAELRTELSGRHAELAQLRADSALVSAETLEALGAQGSAAQAELQSLQASLPDLGEKVAALRAAQASGAVDAMVEAAQDPRIDAAAAALAAGEAGAQLRLDRLFDRLLLQAEAEQARGTDRLAELEAVLDEIEQRFETQSSDLGLVLGTAVLGLREYLHTTIRSTDKLERHTGVLVLGQIPAMAGGTRVVLLR